MDAQTFGTFIADLRRERGMTQAQLAEKLRVTDKAVSRWERGLGFPDINTLEPLAQALGIGIDELMRTERNRTSRPDEQAAQAVVNTVRLANNVATDRRRRILLRTLVAVSVILAAFALLWLLAGFSIREDVFLHDYATLSSGDAVQIRIGIAGSMGYVRSCRNVSDDPTRMTLRFYTAFGGLNSRVGARNVFTLVPGKECTEIWIEGKDEPILRRNAETGEWMRVPK